MILKCHNVYRGWKTRFPPSRRLNDDICRPLSSGKIIELNVIGIVGITMKTRSQMLSAIRFQDGLFLSIPVPIIPASVLQFFDQRFSAIFGECDTRRVHEHPTSTSSHAERGVNYVASETASPNPTPRVFHHELFLLFKTIKTAHLLICASCADTVQRSIPFVSG